MDEFNLLESYFLRGWHFRASTALSFHKTVGHYQPCVLRSALYLKLWINAPKRNHTGQLYCAAGQRMAARHVMWVALRFSRLLLSIFLIKYVTSQSRQPICICVCVCSICTLYQYIEQKCINILLVYKMNTTINKHLGRSQK